MTIELKPEQERIIREAIQSGHFRSPDEVLDYAFAALREKSNAEQAAAKPPKLPRPEGKKNLAQLFAESPFKGLEIDFERDPDYGRDIEL
jgi:Arc/MetJ-type ribon-helix-helix transcriptional regulator